MEHDLSLHSGERQVATTYEAIRTDHRLRYEWADARLEKPGFGLDAFCGNGYGTWLLSKSRVVIGIDGSAEAIRQAEQNYRTPRTHFSVNYYPFELPSNSFDFVVSLESVEHVADGNSFFQTLIDSLKPRGQLIFSTPCENLLPHRMTGNHFHYKHDTLSESLEMASSSKIELLEWAGQNTYGFQPDGKQGGLLPESQMNLRSSEAGQFLIFHCHRR